jgi:excisionase family DNA binding protein
MAIEPLLTTKDVQERYGVSGTTVWKWRKSGALKAVALPGNKIRFLRSELDRFESANAETFVRSEGRASA